MKTFFCNLVKKQSDLILVKVNALHKVPQIFPRYNFVNYLLVLDVNGPSIDI